MFQKIIDQVYKTPIDEPLKLEMLKYEPPAKETTLHHKVKKRYHK